MAWHQLVESLDLAAVPAVGVEADDLDSWEDLRRWREADEPPPGW